MSTERTESKGIRLPASLWEAVDREADSLDLTRNEWLKRRLTKILSASGDVQNQHERVQKGDDEPVGLKQ